MPGLKVRVLTTLSSLLVTIRDASVVTLIVGGLIFFSIFISGYILYVKNALRTDTIIEFIDYKDIPIVHDIYDYSKERNLSQRLYELELVEAKILGASKEKEILLYKLIRFFQLLTLKDASNHDRQQETKALLASIYTSTEGRTGYEWLHELSIWGYIQSFALNHDKIQVIDDLPVTIRTKYFIDWQSDSHATSSRNRLRKEAFEGIIAMMEDKKFLPRLHYDKAFYVTGMQLKAVYLDSYKSELSKEEILKLVDSIKNDASRYQNAIQIIGVPAKIKPSLYPEISKAMIDYVVAEVTGTGTNDISLFKEAEKYLRGIEVVHPSHLSGPIIVNNLNILGALNRVEYKEAEVTEAIQKIQKEIDTYPEKGIELQADLNYWLSPDGEWLTMRQDLFELSRKSPPLHKFFIDLKLENYK